MDLIKLLIVSSNHYLCVGWLTFINTIQPEIITRTNRLCDVTIFSTPDYHSIEKMVLESNCCLLIDKDFVSTPSWHSFISKTNLHHLRVFIINDTRPKSELSNSIMPFKPSLRVIKELIMKAMLSDNFLIENQTELSINNLSEINKEVLRLLIAGKSVREIA